MKKFTITALAAVAAVMMYASCDNGAPKASLKRYGSDPGSEGLSGRSSGC